MTEEAARPPQPGTTSPDGPPPPPTGPAGPSPAAPNGAPRTGYAPPPGGFTSRYGLVRPRDGRYLAGVCAAIGRATNTDPVLWRVIIAVLGFFGGIGILIYLTAWLIIPGEGDTASPVESMLGRGRSSMSPITVIVLSIVVAVTFGYIVTDAPRAVLLGAVILVGGALLLNRQPRNGAERQPTAAAGPAPGPMPSAAWPAPGAAAAPAWSPAGPPPAQRGAGTDVPRPAGPVRAAGYGSEPGAQPSAGFPGTEQADDVPTEPIAGQAVIEPATAGQAVTGQEATWPTAGYPAAPTTVPGGRAADAWRGNEPPTWPGTPTTGGAPLGPPGSLPPSSPVGAPLPPGGYRPPFAPHGPYAGPYPPAPAPVRPVRAPKRPKQRSALGAVTFSLIFLALGVVAVLDLLDVFPVGAAGYFAAALATIGFGLLVGTWFGRARWLIALGLVTAAALGIATVAESYDRVRGIDGNVTWAPSDYQDLAVRYKNNFGDAVLDLRAVDFDQKDTPITVEVNLGKLTVVVPSKVDVTTVADVKAGDATVFGNRSSGFNGPRWETTDLGPDGPGGGTLRLLIHVTAGDLEVTR
ncbi:Predicted membrane protein [Micromonospora viridifaciens]|uniref:Predicted membrane protein n=1 Tax=Micromonospora viridifaciens TaxID=1881 RepID=A0A1C4V4T5_MICVI|nr:PspC domain-containing protein [Micromonospora viridifaciens]SCE79038.1 Predicted membrane protein [Micromonospora viridifaciens]